MAELRLTDAEWARFRDEVVERVKAEIGLSLHDGYMTTKEAAAYLRTSENTLHKMTSARTIPFHQSKPGGRCYFTRAELDEWRKT